MLFRKRKIIDEYINEVSILRKRNEELTEQNSALLSSKEQYESKVKNEEKIRFENDSDSEVLRREIIELNEEISDLEESKARIKEENREKSLLIINLKKQIDSGYVGEIEDDSKIKELSSVIVELTDKNEVLTRKNNELEQKFNAKENALSSAISSKQKEQKDLESKIKKMSREKEEIERQLFDAEDKNKQLVINFEKEIEKLRSQNKQPSNSSVDSDEVTVEELMKENNWLRSDLTELRLKVRQLELENGSKK